MIGVILYGMCAWLLLSEQDQTVSFMLSCVTQMVMCVSFDVCMHTHTYVHACVLLHICECLFFMCVSVRLACLSCLSVCLSVSVCICITNCCTCSHFIVIHVQLLQLLEGQYGLHDQRVSGILLSQFILYVHITHYIVYTRHSSYCMYTSLITLYVYVTRYM